MAEARRTLADVKVAVFAKVIAPWIGVVFRLVVDQGNGVDAAAIGRRLAVAVEADTTGKIAIAPIHEGLRIDVIRSLRHRVGDFRINCRVNAAASALHAGTGEKVAGRVEGEIR